MSEVPIIVNVRDRLTPLRQLVDWLERAGHNRVILLDNDSAWPPLLEYLAGSPHEVIRLGANVGPHAPWASGLVPERFGAEPFVVTDPDVVPDEDCPLNAVDQLRGVLAEHPVAKVGLGLRIDDLPPSYAHRDVVLVTEKNHFAHEVAPGLYQAPVDTTFAIYRPGLPFTIDDALRTGAPLLARHMGWYDDSSAADAERDFYRARARPGSVHWDLAALPQFIRDEYHLQTTSGRGPRSAAIRFRRRTRASTSRVNQAISWHILRRRPDAP